MIDQLSEIVHTQNPASSLSFVPEQRCFYITGFPDMHYPECVEILSQVKSHDWSLTFEEKTAQGIIIFQLIPVCDFQNFIPSCRTLAALRTKVRHIATRR